MYCDQTPGGGGLLYKKVLKGCLYLFRGSNSGLVPLRVSSINRFTTGAFAVPFGVLSQKIMTGDI